MAKTEQKSDQPPAANEPRNVTVTCSQKEYDELNQARRLLLGLLASPNHWGKWAIISQDKLEMADRGDLVMLEDVDPVSFVTRIKVQARWEW